ncbi:MAG: bifunctional 5,10-methylenetetrahydrofolate dehydrogenase/5,10-methenyltetrahydrofolate cyclohydrolase [Candidatus Daviesbacteria bacterium]|nr:bifunctional 5,10-methylenetetrahydrofolate dehydrogenase/5,10-methenyltetrahydrofolate cyclohydrolase [Candidatus Daviesbacteria bacterium]
MKVSGREVADNILNKLKEEIEKKNLKPSLAIILAGDNPSSRVYVNNKIKTAEKIGIKAKLYEFSSNQEKKCLETVSNLNRDASVYGIIVQYPLYQGWDFDEISSKVTISKDVDGFLGNSPFKGATALAVWEMIGAFAVHESFKNAKDFLKGKKVVILGKGKTAGGPTINLLKDKGISITVIDSKTENPNKIIKNAGVVISATGKKNIINGSNIKNGAYVIGVGVGKEIIDEQPRIYGDINEEEVSQKAKLYCPTIGGIGPLTIACLLRNVTEASQRSLSSRT